MSRSVEGRRRMAELLARELGKDAGWEVAVPGYKWRPPVELDIAACALLHFSPILSRRVQKHAQRLRSGGVVDRPGKATPW